MFLRVLDSEWDLCGTSQSDCSTSEPRYRYLDPGVEGLTSCLLEVLLCLEDYLVSFACLKNDTSLGSSGRKEVEAAAVFVGDSIAV